MTSESTKLNYNYLLMTALVVLVLTGFCLLSKFSLVIPLLVLIPAIHLHMLRKASVRLFLNLGLLVVIMMFTAHAFDMYEILSTLYIPVAIVPMLVILLFKDVEMAFVMAFVTSVIVALIAHAQLSFMLEFFIGSMCGVYAVRNARTRGKVFLAGILVGLVQVLCALLLDPQFDSKIAMEVLRPLAVNGVICGLIVGSPLLRIFESLFGEITNFSLLELSDSSNQPLLKRMVIEAPGTYHHSLIVGNLSEAAADAIGAHGLLARVGSYYHDIGKMVKPEYFTENQMMTGNLHEGLEPSMSRLVILNHVKEGIEMAKRYRLNRRIIDFIPQHHGTALIYYFYTRALEESQGQEVNQENYRYPGPKPQTHETAIVMLADSVEGATRALDDHTPNKIEDVVRKVVNNKFIDGQLDECNLTLRDIDIICTTFTRVLSAMYHGRVKYPEKKANGLSGKKLSDENPSQSSQDKTDHS